MVYNALDNRFCYVLMQIGIAIFLCATVLCSTDTDNRNEMLVENTEEFGTNSDSSGSNEIELKNLHLAHSSNTIKDDTESESEKDGKEPVTVTDEQLQSRDNNVDITDTDKTGVENLEHETQDTEQETLESENVRSGDLNSEETNSTWYSWVKYLLDPFLEEFKDGIYSRTNISNSSENTSTAVANSTDLLNVINDTIAFLNVTDSEQNTTDASKKTKFQCTGKNVTDNTNATVRIVSSSRLLQLLSFDKNETENMTDCLVVMFYAPWCHFCAKTAPHYNALSRAFPQLDFVAVDTAQFSNLLARFGTVSVPNILVFHQSRAAVKFNQTERTFSQFVSFVQNTTGLEPNATVNVTEADYIGPISSVPTDDPDIFLWISWVFVILYSSFMFIKSNKGQQWITRIRILWQEHQHID